uniref:G-protein coupled receptors family 1 profile domain-containing protein n=1 Tax=Meloidogyne enterolobii TaxID=390850 RepID=A0A6V7WE63_MELEN|nr:unnamed protein product [Meloidogyne enterolobii]
MNEQNKNNLFPPSSTSGNSGSLINSQSSPTTESLSFLLNEFLNKNNNNLETTEITVHPVEALCFTCKMLAILIYSALSIVAFVGNALILAVFLRFKRLRTPTNMLIANLALGDLMISIFCIPLSYWHVLVFEDQRWIFGAFLCKTFNYLQATAVFVSSWTLVAISFDRFMAIQFSMSPWLKMNRKRALYATLITWGFSLIMALPLLVVNQLESSSEGVDTCLEKWNDFFSDSFVSLYTSSLFALQYCLPLSVLLITYTAIGCKMWNSKVPGNDCQILPSQETTTLFNSLLNTKSARGSTISAANFNICPQKQLLKKSPSSQIVGNNSNRRKSSHTVVHANVSQERKESVKKLIPMVLLVSALYAVCWLPQNLLMNIWVTYDSSALNYPYILYIWWGAHTLAMFHSIVNPFVYYATNRRIHAALKHLLRWLPCLQNARNVALAEFDQTARQKAVTNSFKYPVGDSRRLTLHTQKTISLSMD